MWVNGVGAVRRNLLNPVGQRFTDCGNWVERVCDDWARKADRRADERRRQEALNDMKKAEDRQKATTGLSRGNNRVQK